MRTINKTIVNWHKYIGILICVFLVLLSVTGIFLNHTDDLNLNKRFLNWPWLLNLYGLEVPKPSQNFSLSNDSLTNYDGQIFFNDKLIFHVKDEIKGVTKNNEKLYVAFENEILIFDNTMKVEDILQNIPASVVLFGKNITEKKITIKDTSNQIWSYDEIDQDWNFDDSEIIEWSRLTKISESQKEKMNNYFLGKGISLEQFLLDLHNGAILKKTGKYLLDLIGILTFVLSISGILIWTKRRKR